MTRQNRITGHEDPIGRRPGPFRNALMVTLFFYLSALPATAQSFPWQPGSSETLAERFPAPVGTERLELAEGSFGAWLRGLPVRAEGTPVLLFDGRRKSRQNVHAAVIDLDVGKRDLQQCADAVMRLRAEYLWSAGRAEKVAFDFTSGDRARWSDWAKGIRPVVNGNDVRFVAKARPDDSYDAFRRYLDRVFVYAGSHSLARELEPVEDPGQVEPGDVFIQGGFPGHAVIVVDVAETRTGGRYFLLAQSYMPAQDLHVLKNPEDPSSPWYPARGIGRLETPEWSFAHSDLRRFPSPSAAPPLPPDEPRQVSGDMVRPERIVGESYDFSESGCDLRKAALFIVQLVIDEKGRTGDLQFLKSPGDACLESHIRDTLGAWEFSPATLDGEPVAVFYNLTVQTHFR